MNRAWLLIPASVVVVAGVVGALWALGSASGERAKFSSLEVAPAQADVFFAVNTDPTSPQWLAVNDSLDSINAKDPIREAIDEALAEVNLEWDRDIAPVAGDEAFFSIPDITEVDTQGGWTAGVLLNDPDHAREVFDDLREREDSPPLREEEYNGVTIWVTDEEPGASTIGGEAPSFMQVTPTPVPEDAFLCGRFGTEGESAVDPYADPVPCESDEDYCTWFGYVPRDGVDEPYDYETCRGTNSYCGWYGTYPSATPSADQLPCENFDSEAGGFEPFTDLEQTYEVTFDCGGFGFNVDGTPNDEAFGGETCESDEQYCLWWGFVPTGDEAAPYTIEPCIGASSYCGSYALGPLETPAADGLPCGDDFGFWFEEPVFDDNYFDPGDGDVFEEGDIFSDSTPSTTAIAFVDKVMAMGGSVDDVKGVIDVVQGRADSALANERLQEFREQQKEDFLVWGYVDLANVWEEVEGNVDDSTYGGVDTAELFDQVRTTYDRVGFSVSSFSDGFAFDFTVVHSADFDPENAYEPTKAYDPAIAEILPEDTMFYFSGYDLYNQSWLPGKAQWEDLGLGDQESIQDFIDKFRRESGIDLEPDVLQLLTGEIAFAGNVSDFDDPEVEVIGVAEVNDPIAAHRTMKLLGQYLTEQHILKLRPDEADDIERWDLLDEGEGLTEFIGWQVKDDRVLIAYPDGVVEDLASGGESLADTDDWKRTMDALPGDKTSVGYLSIARILEEIRNTENGEDTFESSTNGEVTLADLEPIRALGMSGSASEKGFGFHLVLFMKDE